MTLAQLARRDAIRAMLLDGIRPSDIRRVTGAGVRTISAIDGRVPRRPWRRKGGAFEVRP